ncbi:hypothetical protein Ahy_A10g047164 [Arachis hypogaea]|uniref:Small nuclear ribonucleoprotein G n=1 Tax=Arachis hypogaea TaxID=3818 RepID=A0A445B1U5_ARAHY|nr:hypothetical protein Ahy_A10g047164 [Arachis hypogaea]
MSRSGQPPDLKKYMDMKLQIKLNANRMIVGTLRGFDQFMNLVVDNTVEVNGNEKNEIGMVVIRGNSVVTVEALEPYIALFELVCILNNVHEIVDLKFHGWNSAHVGVQKPCLVASVRDMKSTESMK